MANSFVNIKVQGLDEISRAFRELKRRTNGVIAEQIALEGAEIVKEEYQRDVPRGPSGRLRRSALAFKGRRASKLGAYAIFWLQFSTAAHAPLVEFGTDERVAKIRKVMKIPVERLIYAARGFSGFIFRKRVKGVTPNPVFKRSVESKASEVLAHIIDREKALIEDVKR